MNIDIQGRGLFSRGTTLIALQIARAALSRFHQTLAYNGAYRLSPTFPFRETA